MSTSTPATTYSRHLTVAATFTAEPIRPYLDFWLETIGLTHEIEVAPPGQIFQSLLGPGRIAIPGRILAIVLLVRLEDWELQSQRATDDRQLTAASRRRIEANLHDLIDTLKTLVSPEGPRCLLLLTPPSPDALQDLDRAKFYRHMESLARNHFKGTQVAVIESSELFETQVDGSYYEPHSDVVAQLPYSDEFFAQLAAVIARHLYASQIPPFKVIVLDADETLWKGTCAEVGPKGVEVDSERHHLQSFLRRQRERGRLLCLCSKNDPADVAAVFEQNPQMPLKWSDFTARRINWQLKSENLHSLAAELGLDIDSFIFIDDSPIECAEMVSAYPEVLTLQLPSEPEQISAFLRNQWAFDIPPSTNESGNRAQFYEQNKEREQLKSRVPTLASFLASLNLEVKIRPPDPSEWTRVSELTFRTNQFNCTTVRRSIDELSSFVEAGGECLIVEAKDRFGEYGVIGVMLFRKGRSALEVNTFLLSCRALGRGIEHRMLATLGETALEEGCERILVPYTPTNRNQPVRNFLEEVGRSYEDLEDGGRLYCWLAREAAAIKLDALRSPLGGGTSTLGGSPMLEASSSSKVALERNALLHRIAEELADPRAVLKAVKSFKSPWNLNAPNRSTPPRTPTEEALAAIWCDLLGSSGIGIDHNFFELGGDSLQAVKLTSRVRETFGVDLPLGTFFQEPTIASLAAHVCKGLAEKHSQGPSANLVDWVDQLLEEEALGLLGQAAKSHVAVSQDTVSHAGSKTGQLEIAEIIAILEQCCQVVTTPSSPAPISTLGILTCNRSAAFDRALDSYLREVLRAGRDHTRIAVLDDSRNPAAAAAVQRTIRTLKGSDRERVVFAGQARKRRFAERLMAATGVPPEVLEFALFDPARVGHTSGANRNALALEAAGEVYFAVDDDTLCDLGPSPFLEKGLAIVSGRDPCELWAFENREEAMHSVRFVEADLLGLHEQILGKTGAEIVATQAANASLIQVSDPLGCVVPRIVNGTGRVLVTFNGLVGDCAWGAPFGVWGAPMGYLLLSGSSLARLVKSEDDYRTALTRREVLRVVRRITLADGICGMLTFAGLDNRDVLPPSMPVRRGQDLVFCATLRISSDEALFAHLPWVLHHSPGEVRRFWRGEVFRTAGSFDTAKLFLECLAISRSAEVNGKGERLRALGRSLVALGALPLDDFESLLRRQAKETARHIAALAEETIAAAGGGPEFWVTDVRRFVDLHFRALDRESAVIPLDLLKGNDLREALLLGQQLVGRFGELLTWWPTLGEAAAEQRLKGERLAVPISAVSA